MCMGASCASHDDKRRTRQGALQRGGKGGGWDDATTACTIKTYIERICEWMACVFRWNPTTCKHLPRFWSSQSLSRCHLWSSHSAPFCMEVDQWTQVISSFVLSLCVVSISQKRTTTNNNNNNINPLCKAARDTPKQMHERKKPGSVLCCSLMFQSLRFRIPISLCFECLVCIGCMFVCVLFGVTHISVRDHPSGVRHALTGLITFILVHTFIYLFAIAGYFTALFRSLLFSLSATPIMSPSPPPSF